MRRDVFQAIADPTRREIMGLLAQRPLNLNALADHFPISRPAISKHIKILTQCGLVIIRQEGRERFCKPNFSKLHQVSLWIEQYKQFWDTKLNALEQYLDNNQKTNQPSTSNQPPKAKQNE